MNIGLLGGTFDPVHFAHLRMAEQAMEQLHFYQLMFLPCYKMIAIKPLFLDFF
jgi:nicotinate-nucleotide adenylyltransferase